LPRLGSFIRPTSSESKRTFLSPRQAGERDLFRERLDSEVRLSLERVLFMKPASLFRFVTALFFFSSVVATFAQAQSSAADRARTVAVAIDAAQPSDALVSPGHVFPLVAKPGGVLVRAGHTEAAVDVARPDGVIFIGEAPTNMDGLTRDLSAALTKDDPTIPPTEQRVYIRADRDVIYGDFMAVMNDLQGNGFYQVALINEEL